MKQQRRSRRASILVACLATIMIGTAGMPSNAAATKSLRSCPDKSISYEGKHVLIKAVKVQDLTCAQGYQILRESFNGNLPPGFHDGPGSFPVPDGFFGQVVSDGSKKIQFAVPGA